MSLDERVLGSGRFTEGLMEEAQNRHIEKLRHRGRTIDLKGLGQRVSEGQGVDLAVIRCGSRDRRVVAARRLFCQLAVGRMGYTGVEVARYLGATTSFPPQAGLTNSEELPE